MLPKELGFLVKEIILKTFFLFLLVNSIILCKFVDPDSIFKKYKHVSFYGLSV